MVSPTTTYLGGGFRLRYYWSRCFSSWKALSQVHWVVEMPLKNRGGKIVDT